MTDPLAYAQQIAYSTKETLMFTHSMAVKFKDSSGVYCECGCAAGAQVIALAYGAPNKTIYAFDSWEGIPKPSNRDNQMPGIRLLTESEQRALPDPGEQVLESSGATVVSEADFWCHLDNALIPPGPTYSIPTELKLPNIRTVKGWFEQSVPEFIDEMNHIDMETRGVRFKIAILRLDGDLYNSTWVCLQHLFPKVTQGGCVIVDDIQLPGCKAAVDEYFDLINYQPKWEYISNIAYFFK